MRLSLACCVTDASKAQGGIKPSVPLCKGKEIQLLFTIQYMLPDNEELGSDLTGADYNSGKISNHSRILDREKGHRGGCHLFQSILCPEL